MVLHHLIAELACIACVGGAIWLASAHNGMAWVFIVLSVLFTVSYKQTAAPKEDEFIAKRYDILDSNGITMGLSAKTREELPPLGRKDTVVEWTARKVK